MNHELRIVQLEEENAVLRTQVEVGVTKYLGLTHVLTEQAAVHKARADLLERETQRAAKHVATTVVLGRRLDGVRQELTARAEAAEARVAELEDLQRTVAYHLGPTQGVAS